MVNYVAFAIFAVFVIGLVYVLIRLGIEASHKPDNKPVVGRYTSRGFIRRGQLDNRYHDRGK